jgi:hypothetical protein
MKIDKIETFVIQAKWTDEKAYWEAELGGRSPERISPKYPLNTRPR